MYITDVDEKIPLCWDCNGLVKLCNMRRGIETNYSCMYLSIVYYSEFGYSVDCICFYDLRVMHIIYNFMVFYITKAGVNFYVGKIMLCFKA